MGPSEGTWAAGPRARNQAFSLTSPGGRSQWLGDSGHCPGHQPRTRKSTLCLKSLWPVGPHQLPVLCLVVYICQSQSPNSYHAPRPPAAINDSFCCAAETKHNIIKQRYTTIKHFSSVLCDDLEGLGVEVGVGGRRYVYTYG